MFGVDNRNFVNRIKSVVMVIDLSPFGIRDKSFWLIVLSPFGR